MKRNMLLVTLVLGATFSMVSSGHLAMVHFRWQNNKTHCSASIISTNLVLTSAHCLYHPSQSGQSFEKYSPMEVHVASGFKRNRTGKVVQQSNKFQVSEVIPHPEYIKSNKFYKRIGFDIGLVRLTKPINFHHSYQSLKPVTLARPTDQFQEDQCVLETWAKQTGHVRRTKVTLKENVLPGVPTSPLIGHNLDGYPVMCRVVGLDSEIQVALVTGVTTQFNHFTRVPPLYKWIESYCLSFHFQEQPSGSRHTNK